MHLRLLELLRYPDCAARFSLPAASGPPDPRSSRGCWHAPTSTCFRCWRCPADLSQGPGCASTEPGAGPNMDVGSWPRTARSSACPLGPARTPKATRTPPGPYPADVVGGHAVRGGGVADRLLCPVEQVGAGGHHAAAGSGTTWPWHAHWHGPTWARLSIRPRQPACRSVWHAADRWTVGRGAVAPAERTAGDWRGVGTSDPCAGPRAFQCSPHLRSRGHCS
jgi:hypothetical protein